MLAHLSNMASSPNTGLSLVGVRKLYRLVIPCLLATSMPASLAYAVEEGEKLVTSLCAGCHQTGVAGAPRLGNKEDWAARVAQGIDVLVEHSISGFKGMPPKGGQLALTNDQITRAVSYMVSLVASPQDNADKVLPATPETVATPPVESVELPGEPKSAAAVVRPVAKPEIKKANVSRVNSFNRLMKPTNKRNPPPSLDGIHDPNSEGTAVLLPPRAAFTDLPKGKSGNYVDWVGALERGSINPRYDKLDPDKKPVVLDLNIVREVKGSMPDVVYPHKQHTEWLDCSNCHPAIFFPQKGKNPMSMAGILLGEKCGVCHGKVAFPVAECRRCHSKKKSASIAQAAKQ